LKYGGNIGEFLRGRDKIPLSIKGISMIWRSMWRYAGIHDDCILQGTGLSSSRGGDANPLSIRRKIGKRAIVVSGI